MISRYSRYAILGLRILLPSRAEARYGRAIRQSGLFDRAWYLACNPRLPWLCRKLPERHYVLVGEAVGMCPNPQFSPKVYLHLHPELAAQPLPPFAHYIAAGRAAGAAASVGPAGQAAPVLPVIDVADRPATPAPVAILLHLYYRQMWPEMAALIRRQTFAHDLYITLTTDRNQPDGALRQQIRRDFPAARVWTLPNHGRDILPFLHLAQSGLFAPYAALCKLHTKKSPHRGDGDAWRQVLLAGVLGDPQATAARLARFLADPTAGFWVADGQRNAGAAWWGANRARGADLAHRFGLDPAGELEFPAGSIYWVKPAVLNRLAHLPISAADFEPEMGQVDGTTAHVLERLIGMIGRDLGLTTIETAELDQMPAPDGSVPPR